MNRFPFRHDLATILHASGTTRNGGFEEAQSIRKRRVAGFNFELFYRARSEVRL
jgi:hypothetical protein